MASALSTIAQGVRLMRVNMATPIVLLCACGGASATVSPETPSPEARREPSVRNGTSREAQLEGAIRENRELEARLALAIAQTRDLEEQIERDRTALARRTVRIGGCEPNQESTEDWGASGEEESDPRPVLRLHEEPEPPPLIVPPAPDGVATRLSLWPLAEPPGPEPESETTDRAVGEYRGALDLVRSERFGDAVGAFTRFIERFPSHPYADNALYWRGEAQYGQRQYLRALEDFEAVVERFPHGNKVPDALLKIAFCHQRLGDAAAASAFFERVVREFPSSVAAQLASREDAS